MEMQTHGLNDGSIEFSNGNKKQYYYLYIFAVLFNYIFGILMFNSNPNDRTSGDIIVRLMLFLIIITIVMIFLYYKISYRMPNVLKIKDYQLIFVFSRNKQAVFNKSDIVNVQEQRNTNIFTIIKSSGKSYKYYLNKTQGEALKNWYKNT